MVRTHFFNGSRLLPCLAILACGDGTGPGGGARMRARVLARLSGTGILLAALLSGCGDVGGPGSGPPGTVGPILFLGGSAYTNSQHLYVVHTDGSGLRQLTSGPHNVGSAFWSHDGTRIYFTRDTGAPPYHYVMKADGSGLEALASFPPGEGRDWSADASRKAFTAFVPLPDDPPFQDNRDLFVRNADSTEVLRLIDLGGPCDGGFFDCADVASIDWSPTGEWIAYSTWMTGRAYSAYADLAVVRPDGSEQRTLVPHTGSDPAWSPDGRLLAYSDGDKSYVIRPWDLAVTDLNGRRRTLVDGDVTTTINFNPAWTADGGHIVFSRAPLGQPDSSEVYIVSASGSGLRRVIGLPGGSFVQDVNPLAPGPPSFP